MLEGQFPFFAAVVVKLNGESWQCAGSVIDEEYIMTTASCLVKKGWELEGVKLKVGIGYTDMEDNPGTWHNVKSYTLNNQFKYPKNDFAVLKLAKAVDFDASVQPACFPNKDTHSSHGFIIHQFLLNI